MQERKTHIERGEKKTKKKQQLPITSQETRTEARFLSTLSSKNKKHCLVLTYRGQCLAKMNIINVPPEITI